MKNKMYVGDGVYVEMDQWARVTLTTENGIEVQNRIILEDEVIAHLLAILKKWGKVGGEP